MLMWEIETPEVLNGEFVELKTMLSFPSRSILILEFSWSKGRPEFDWLYIVQIEYILN